MNDDLSSFVARFANSLKDRQLTMTAAPSAFPVPRVSFPIPSRDGKKHHEAGIRFAKKERWKQALREFQLAASYAPDQPNYHYAYGMALCHSSRFGEAINAFQRELKIIPEHGPALTELGACLARCGNVDDGIALLKRGLKHMHNLPVAHYNLGLALLGKGERQEAILSCSWAIALKPKYGVAHALRGLAHAMGDDDDHALQDFYAAAAADPQNYDVMMSLGVIQDKKGSKGGMVNATHLFQMAAHMAPDVALAQYAFGQFLINYRSFDLGLDYIERALKLDPTYAPSYVARGFALLGQGLVEESVASFRRGGELSPHDAKIAGTVLFALQHKPGVTKADLLEAHKRWGALYRPEAPRNRIAFENDPDPLRPLRIGLVSADLHRHAVAYLTMRAFAELASLGYELHCYKTDRKLKDDDFSDRFKAMSKSWTDVTDLDVKDFAALIEEHKIDILFDLAGHTAGNRLNVFAERAAPVQLTWAGYVGTIGLDTYDGIIADPIEIPETDDAFYLEPVVRLPDCYVCYQPPVESPDPGPLPFFQRGVFTFGCFNRPAKLNAEVGRAWARIIERVPNARILMVYGGLEGEKTREGIYTILENGGLSREHVELIGERDQPKLLQAYAEQVDLALDPFPYSGGVTTLEALWMGVPTVTFVGDTFAGRHSATHLTAAGVPDFCTDSVEAYVDLAVNWAHRPQELAEMRAGLREKLMQSPLNDQVRFGANLDRALRGVWREWCEVRRESLG